ncbi:LrgA family protein [compost metagenome]
MPLLLVPAATGVMAYFQVIEKQLWPIVGTLVLSLLPSMYFSGWLMQRLIKRQQPGEEE